MAGNGTLAGAIVYYLGSCSLFYSMCTDGFASGVLPDCAYHANFSKGRSLEKGTYYKDQLNTMSFWCSALSKDLQSIFSACF